MFRFILDELYSWLAQKERKPMVLRGARQVGKTWLVRELAKRQGRDLIELNFERNPEFVKLFRSNQVTKVITEIEASFKITINPEVSLIFLDEIQVAPELLAKLRWFAEEMPSLPVIAAGSLLEFALKDFQYSMPVGRINYVYLEPFSFEEFLLALGYEKLLELIRNYQITEEVSDVIHNQLLDLVKDYLLVGGLPAAVASWCEHQSLEKINQVHFDLLATYRDDFSKYTKRIDTKRLDEVLSATPTMLGEKFVYRNVNDKVRTQSVQLAFELLKQAKIVHDVVASSGNGLPLKAEVNEKYFKAILIDVGIAGALLGLNLSQLRSSQDIILVNKGGMAEQFVGQQLRCLFPHYMSAELFYWLRVKKNANAEVDYLIQHKHFVVPVEVKAGRTGSLKSLHSFMHEKKLSFAVRFNTDAPSIVDANVKTTTGEPVNYKLLSLPLYLSGQLPRLLDDVVKDLEV